MREKGLLRLDIRVLIRVGRLESAQRICIWSVELFSIRSYGKVGIARSLRGYTLTFQIENY